jgi:preprotein translocase subunit YajC
MIRNGGKKMKMNDKVTFKMETGDLTTTVSRLSGIITEQDEEHITVLTKGNTVPEWNDVTYYIPTEEIAEREVMVA